jgi:K+-transporting ATPase ATPase C chain
MIAKQMTIAILLTVVLSVLTGAIFPLLVWMFAQLFFPYQANGSFIKQNNVIVGSELIGQKFSSARYFHPRPSAAGSGYDSMSSGGTNLGPTSKKLFSGLPDDPSTNNVDESFLGIASLAKRYREENGLNLDTVLPADAVTHSASGLDPHISPQNALLQAGRVARERGLSREEVKVLIEAMVEQRFLGIIGEPRVNVLKLNLTLDATLDVTKPD